MRLLRYGPAGQEKPGLLDNTGTLRDLSGVVPDSPTIQVPVEMTVASRRPAAW